MNLEEFKDPIEAKFRRALWQMKTGCRRPLCLNPFCGKNPVRAFTSDKSVHEFLSQRAQTHTMLGFPDFIFCSEPFSVTPTSAEGIRQLYSSPESLVLFYIEDFLSEDNITLKYSTVVEYRDIIKDLVSAGELESDWLIPQLNNFGVTPYSRIWLPGSILILLIQLHIETPLSVTVIIKLCQLVKRSPYMHNQLSKVFEVLSAPDLEFIVKKLQEFVSHYVKSNRRRQEAQKLDAILLLLSLLYKSNERRPRVRYQLFMNSAVSKELLIEEEYKRWRAPQKKKRKLAAPDNFTFLNYPWILNLKRKISLLNYDNHQTMRTHMSYNVIHMMFTVPFLQLNLRRDYMVQDAMDQLLGAEINYKKPLKVSFVGEEGVDGGGLRKEFFQLIIKELFDPKFGMFVYNEQSRLFWFNPLSIDSTLNFELIGIILGMAIYNGNNLSVKFPSAIYKKIQNAELVLEDFKGVDEELHAGFIQMLNFEGDVKEVYLRNFVIELEHFGQMLQIDLINNGSNIPVTNENKRNFVDCYAQWCLTIGVHTQFEAFKKGLLKVCGGEVLKMMRPEELEILICGYDLIDLQELELVTKYDNGYTNTTPVVIPRQIENLWRTLHSLSQEDKKKFLMFTTGSERVPAVGLASLNFTICRNGQNSNRLMTAHVCFNQLLLPEYEGQDKLQRLLLIAINNAEGFGLR